MYDTQALFQSEENIFRRIIERNYKRTHTQKWQIL